MKGLELSRAFYEQYGLPMLEEQFPQELPLLAVGLLGGGSECFGFDDEVSQDHDFEPGFCIFLPGEDVLDRRTAFRLERAYAKLPKEFEGFRRPMLLPVGGARRGVMRLSEFFTAKTGAPDGVLTLGQWLTAPEQGLAECVNGAVWFDNYGELTAIRERLAYFPEDVRLKRLAGQLLLMAQAGQYNYVRILRHGEPAAAQLALCEFVKSAMAVIFLLNRRYMPYYKWSFRAGRDAGAAADDGQRPGTGAGEAGRHRGRRRGGDRRADGAGADAGKLRRSGKARLQRQRPRRRRRAAKRAHPRRRMRKLVS